MSFQLQGIAFFLEGNAEIDVVNKPATYSVSVGGWFGGWGHAIAHEDGRIVLGHD